MCLERLSLAADRIASDEYRFHLPVIRSLDISFTTDVTFLVWESGTGKSTVIEAIAAAGGPQFIFATHSPIPLTCPGAPILSVDGPAVHEVSLADTSHYQITRGILEHPEFYWRHLRAAAADVPAAPKPKDRGRRRP